MAEIRHRNLRGFSGGLRLVFRFLWWNVFGLVGGLLLLGFAQSTQGAELGLIAGREPFTSKVLLNTLLALVSLDIFLAGYLIAYAGRGAVESLAASTGLHPATAQLWLQVCLPAFLAGLIHWTLVASLFGLGWAVAGIGLLLPILLLIHRWITNLSENGLNGRWIAIALLIVSVAAPIGPALWLSEGTLHWARLSTPVGAAAGGVGLWVLCLSSIFVALPLHARLPSLALLAPTVWFAASYTVNPNAFPRDVDAGQIARSSLSELRRGPQPTSVYLALVKWLRQFEDDPRQLPIPVVLVSAEGGGIRASYWTAEVLSRLDVDTGGKFARYAFAYSGVSGGAFGVTAFALATRDRRVSPSENQRRLRSLFSDDYLSPLVGAMTVTEPLWQLIPLRSLMIPRDSVFERAWEQSWRSRFGNNLFGEPFWKVFDIENSAAPVPILALNTTNVESGKRVIISNIGLTTQRQDFFEFWNAPGVYETSSGLRVSEAAHLSARFPFLSPPAAIQGAIPTGAGKASNKVALRTWGHLVDGGYFDNSGTIFVHDIVQDLYDIWLDAHRGIEHVSNAEGLDWERDRKLFMRMRIHVLVLRNDPYKGESADRLEFPTLRAGAEMATEADALEKQYNSGAFLEWLPTISPLQELLAPGSAMVAAREARGAASRRLLSVAITGMNNNQQVQCEMSARAQQKAPLEYPIRFKAGCLRKNFTSYSEVSLADAILELDALRRERPGEAPSLEFCPEGLTRRDVALGWVLSTNSMTMLRCAASVSDPLKKLADTLDPDGVAARKPRRDDRKI